MRAYFLWESEGRPVGQSEEYWERARELDAIERNCPVLRPNLIVSHPRETSEGVLIEEASLQENLGEFPSRFTDQGDTMPTPESREIAREFRDGERSATRYQSMGNDGMDIREAMAGRRAVREYRAEAVDEQTIRHLIADAVRAPSAMNEQPWSFTVVRDQTLLDRVSHESKAHMLATTPASAQPAHFHSMLDNAAFQIFYHAPVLVWISAATEEALIVEDCSLAAQNLMLAAYAAGLGSCWIGLAQSYQNTPEGKAALHLPAAWVQVAPIILGHPTAATTAVPRNAPEIHWVG